jgi:hypothetical protein
MKTAQSPQPFALTLVTSRGSEVPHAPSGRPIDLSLDITGLSLFSTYTVDVVDESGRVQLQSKAAETQAKAGMSLPGDLRPGNYFVRLYSPSRELLREYGLHID